MHRIALCFALIFVLWDIKSVFYAIWTPFDWLVGYTDPRKGKQDRLHGEHRGCTRGWATATCVTCWSGVRGMSCGR